MSSTPFIKRALNGMLGAPSEPRQRDALVIELKRQGYSVTEFRPQTGHLDARTAQAVAALARQGLAVADASGAPLGSWKAV
jgi:hypothetical protein